MASSRPVKHGVKNQGAAPPAPTSRPKGTAMNLLKRALKFLVLNIAITIVIMAIGHFVFYFFG